jgi:hypothetical protein
MSFILENYSISKFYVYVSIMHLIDYKVIITMIKFSNFLL